MNIEVRKGAGRPAGSKNLVSGAVKEMISQIVTNGLENLPVDLKEMKPRDRVRFLIELLPFIIPKQKEIDNRISLSRMSEDDLDQLLQNLIENDDNEQ